MLELSNEKVRHKFLFTITYEQIVRALEGNLALHDLNDGVLPGHSRAYSPFGSSDYDSGQFQDDLKKFRKIALESREMTTSEFSGPTSEFGVHPSSSSSEIPQSAVETESGSNKKDVDKMGAGQVLSTMK